ncbi:FHA domain protein [Cordyceps militaris CM01]|uniref:FHA domain protein n=1 Tax=Cordyceps militaris (strain CM01) TaxID=983644 RepID=G3J4V2_CORMM|nr:FHA domain protein [Cordyceps militaris CM01]EGX95919.1 FHA domain protein [Cordyceps militaris CM01]
MGRSGACVTNLVLCRDPSSVLSVQCEFSPASWRGCHSCLEFGLVTLCVEPVMSRALGEGEDLSFPQRRILLSNRKNTAPIGRASKRSSTLEARMYNAWIDAPVMSREHAELKFDSQSQMVFIRDVRSLHGTYHNDIKLRPGQSQALRNGDSLKFGICIERGHDRFPQCTMKIGLEFGQAGQQATAEPSLPQATVFQVPDDTDSEDMDDADEIDSQAAFSSIDDDEDPTVQASAAVLRENGLQLVEVRGFKTSDAIDLTSEPDLTSEDNAPTSSSPFSDDPHLPHPNSDYVLGVVDFNDDEPGTLNNASSALPSDDFAPATRFREIGGVDVADDSVPGMEGPLSEDQHLSAISDIIPSVSKARSLGELSGKPEYFLAREQNRFCIQHSVTPRDAQTQEETHVPEHSNNTEETSVPCESSLKKRKFEQISASIPPDDSFETPGASPSQEAQQVRARDVRTDVDTDLAYKRVKAAAEYVGLMAIGGVAVITALIATAPTF